MAQVHLKPQRPPAQQAWPPVSALQPMPAWPATASRDPDRLPGPAWLDTEIEPEALVQLGSQPGPQAAPLPEAVPGLQVSETLNAADAAAWQSAWTAPGVSAPAAMAGGMRFSLELRTWGRLEIDCAPLQPRGWHVSIGSENAAVRRRLRLQAGRLGDALRELAGHNDMTLEIDA